MMILSNCMACGAKRKAKKIGYDPNTLQAYCHVPYICNDNHPNAVKALLERGSELPLVPHHEIADKLQALLEQRFTSGNATKIRRLLTEAISVRLQDAPMAQFLESMQERHNFDSISETIRHCIQLAMDVDSAHNEYKAEVKEQKEFKKLVNEVVAPTTEDDDNELEF